MKTRVYQFVEKLKFGFIIIMIGGLIMLANQCLAQEVTITLKDSTVLKTKITATSTNTLHTTGGNVKKDDVAKADFVVQRSFDTPMYDDLTARGVKVTFTGQPLTKKELVVAKSPIVQNKASIDMPMERFRMQRTYAKSTQLVGALIFGGAIVAQAINNDKYKKDLDDYLENGGKVPTQKFIPTAVYAGGIGILCIGIAIDIDAGKHLKP